MANYLSQYAPRRSFGFAGQEGDMFDVANQPNMLANIISNESIAAQGAPRNYLQRAGGQMIDLGESAPMNNLRGSIVDVFGQGKGYMQPDGTIVGVNQAGQKFRVQPEGTQAAQAQARMGDLNRRMMEAKLKQEEAQAKMAGSPEGVKPQFVADMGGYVYPPTPDNPNGRFVPVAGAPKAGKGGAASEDERKAAGWLAQADNAYKNMASVMEATGGEAAAPSLSESLLPESMRGAVRSAPRQQFVQATSSLSEALLRAATGAGVNKDEAMQKIKELTPEYLDKPETRKQKLDAIPVYLESLKARAGRAAPENYEMPQMRMGTAPTSQDVAANLPSRNAEGWTLHTDAQGNRAYVSPDGKQFKEVR